MKHTKLEDWRLYASRCRRLDREEKPQQEPKWWMKVEILTLAAIVELLLLWLIPNGY